MLSSDGRGARGRSGIRQLRRRMAALDAGTEIDEALSLGFCRCFLRSIFSKACRPVSPDHLYNETAGLLTLERGPPYMINYEPRLR